jgi:hypothetical protein
MVQEEQDEVVDGMLVEPQNRHQAEAIVVAKSRRSLVWKSCLVHRVFGGLPTKPIGFLGRSTKPSSKAQCDRDEIRVQPEASKQRTHIMITGLASLWWMRARPMENNYDFLIFPPGVYIF